MPIRGISAPRGAARMTSADLLMSLSYVQRTFDKKGKSWRA
jgi:hypothetical protein